MCVSSRATSLQMKTGVRCGQIRKGYCADRQLTLIGDMIQSPVYGCLWFVGEQEQQLFLQAVPL
jgi:hypothetical protein